MAHDPSLSTAAAALHALDESELRELEEHAADCAECSTELVEFRETAARLGAALSVEPPAGMRDAVLATIGSVRQLPPEPLPQETTAPELPAVQELAAQPISLDSRRRTTRRNWTLAVAAVVALLTVVGAMFFIGRSTEQADPLRDCLATASDERTMPASPSSVGTVTTTDSASCGAALVQISGVPAAPADHTYQMWVITGDQTRSVATMDPDDTGTMPDVVTAVHVGDTAVGVTVEPAGGSPVPTSEPVIVVPLV